MIWNNEILFIHTPKTAGMSMTRMLQQYLKRPVFLTEPVEQDTTENGVTHLPGQRHETLLDAASLLSYRNIRLESFRNIFTVMRNPYDLELSRYAYLKQGLPQDRGRAQRIALDNDFRDYLRQAPILGMNPPRLDLYFQLNGIMPENLVVLKFERLNQDISTFLSPYLEPGYELHHENASKHDSYQDVYDQELEQLCFERNRWFFEKGFYSRL